jgi:hypothetical protein
MCSNDTFCHVFSSDHCCSEHNYVTHCPLCILNTHDAAEGDSTFCLQVKEILLQLSTVIGPLHQEEFFVYFLQQK